MKTTVDEQLPTRDPCPSPVETLPRSIKRAVVVIKETYLDQVRSAGDKAQLADIAARKPGVENVTLSNEQHQKCIALVTEALTARGIVFQTVQCSDKPLTLQLDEIDLVITVGGDGTFLRASHEIRDAVPMLGVNSAPLTSFGHFCCCNGAGFAAVLDRMISGDFQPSRLLRLRLSVNGETLPVPVLNEVLVAHIHPAGTTRYLITVGDQSWQHKGSGLLVSSPSGSTGFLRSEGGTVLPIIDRSYTYLERARFLAFGEVRKLKTGAVNCSVPMTIVSQMQDGRLFIDGEHIEYPFPRGAKLTINAGENDLLAYVDPSCHGPYIRRGWLSWIKTVLRSLLPFSDPEF